MTNDPLTRTLRSGPPHGASPLPDVAAAAAAAGLADVVYASLDSPVGRLVLAASPRGLVRIAYADDGENVVLADLAARVSPRLLADPRPLEGARRELDEYFRGRRHRFELALDRRLLSAFAGRVLAATAEIPYGTTASYRDVASAAGSPRGSRAAGNALGSNPLPIVLPCHRVVHADGGLGGYTGGVERKRTLLAIESGSCS